MVEQQLLADYAKGYAEQLTSEGREWLMNRGLTARTVRTMLLGEVVKPMSKEHQKYTRLITIPYMTLRNTVNIRFRWYHGSTQTAKYIGLKGMSNHLYQVSNTSQPSVWLCEGEFDSLILTQMGFPAVGVPGVNSFKTEWRYLLANAEIVTLVFDGDDAGRKGSQRLLHTLRDVVDQIRLVYLPEGMDVTDMYLENQAELRKLVM